MCFLIQRTHLLHMPLYTLITHPLHMPLDTHTHTHTHPLHMTLCTLTHQLHMALYTLTHPLHMPLYTRTHVLCPVSIHAVSFQRGFPLRTDVIFSQFEHDEIFVENQAKRQRPDTNITERHG